MAATANTRAQQPTVPHKLTLDERRRLEVTGVTEVIRFDDQTVVVKTVRGLLILRGENLRLQTLAPESGRVCVDGVVNSLAYESVRESEGFWKRLFG